MKYAIPFLLFVVLFAQCKKEPAVICSSPGEQIVGPPEEGPCENVPAQSMTGETLFPDVYPIYYGAYFNPNNADEMVFLYQRDSSYWLSTSLVKYNWKTKEHQILKDLMYIPPHFFSNPRWGKKDWIVLGVYDGIRIYSDAPGINIYKVQSNGENFEAVSTTGAGYSPEFDSSGEKFMYWFSLWPSVVLPVIDIETNEPVDVLGGGGAVRYEFCWQHDSLLIYGGQFGCKLMIPNTGELISLYEEPVYEGNPMAFGATWIDDEHVLWCAPAGVFVTNVFTAETEKLFDNCALRTITMPCYAPSINKVLFSYIKLVRDADDPDRGVAHHNIGMMNPDGTDFEVLDINLE